MPEYADMREFVRAELLPALVDDVDRDCDRIVGAGIADVGRRPSCDACTTGACCRYVVAATIGDGLIVAHYLWEQGRDTPELRANLLAIGAEHERLGCSGVFERGLGCPFLDEANRCTVYPARPVNCRSYYCWTPPAACAPPVGDVMSGDNDPALLRGLAVSGQLQTMLGIGVDVPCIAPLPTMVGLSLAALDARTLEEVAAPYRAHLWRSMDELLHDWGSAGWPRPDGGKVT